MDAGERGGWRAWPHTLAAVGVWVGAQLVPLPGVDHDALRHAMQPGGLRGLFSSFPVPLISPFDAGLAVLVLARLVGALGARLPGEPSRVWSRVGFLLYLCIVVVRAYGIAVYLEGAPMAVGVEVVASPGLGFVLVTVASYVGGGAVTWALVEWIGRRGIGSGTMVLLLVSGAIGYVDSTFLLAAQLSAESSGPADVLAHLLYVVPLVIALVALGRWTPRKLPMSLFRGVGLVSPVDVLAAPYLSGASLTMVLVSLPMVLAELSVPGFAGAFAPVVWLRWLGLAASVALALLLAAWLRREPERRRSLPALVLAFAVPVVAVALLGVAMVTSAGSFGRALSRSPYAGDADFDVILVGGGGRVAHDASVLRARLSDLRLDPNVEREGTDRLRVRLEGVRDGRELMALLLVRGELAFALVAADQTPLDAAARVPGRTVAIECEREGDGRAPRCHPWLLEDPPVLTGADVTDASVRVDPQDGKAYVAVTFSERGGRRFYEVTRRAVSRQLAIVVDGSVLSVPVIQSAIPGGRAQVTMGAMAPERTLTEATALALALRSGALSGAWRVASMRPSP